MIKTFRHKGLKQLFGTGKSVAVAQELAKRVKIVLDYLDAAITVYDMGAPGLPLHELKGERKGTWSVTVSGNWRITFGFRGGDAYDVDLEDYH
jgi:proteic killer suppression protein